MLFIFIGQLLQMLFATGLLGYGFYRLCRRDLFQAFMLVGMSQLIVNGIKF